MNKQDCNPSQYYQEDFLASHSVQPGSGEARRMTVTSGQRCLELFKISNPVGLLAKMLLESSVWSSTRCFLTWKRSATPARRLLFRLVPSMPRTEETAAQLWLSTPTGSASARSKEFSEGRTPTPAEYAKMWPTPRANDAEKRGNVSADPRNGLPGAVGLWPTPTTPRPHDSENTVGKYIPSQKQKDLAYAVAMFPTPIASDYKNRGCKDYRKNRQCQLQTTIGGQLNPDWVEWLMGFPAGWTNLPESQECAPE